MPFSGSHGVSIHGYALDVILVQPYYYNNNVELQEENGNHRGAKTSTSTTESVDCHGVYSSSDFHVVFDVDPWLPSRKKREANTEPEFVIQMYINDQSIPCSMLSMYLRKPNPTELQSGYNQKCICCFNQSHSRKPPSHILKKLVDDQCLHLGQNTIRYVLRKSQQFDTDDQPSDQNIIGDVMAFLYLWGAHDRIVVTDIDGTITRTDVGGVWDSVVTRRYTHVHDGICDFFSRVVSYSQKHNSDTERRTQSPIHPNKFPSQMRILYLTSRPSFLIDSTRHFLTNLTQLTSSHNKTYPSILPPGPILVQSGSLSSVLLSELIHKTSHEYKASALTQQVVLPFLSASSPHLSKSHHHPPVPLQSLFVAGFGNKETDYIAYRTVGIDPQQIFIIDEDSTIITLAHYSHGKIDDCSYGDRLKRERKRIQPKTALKWILGCGSDTTSFSTKTKLELNHSNTRAENPNEKQFALDSNTGTSHVSEAKGDLVRPVHDELYDDKHQTATTKLDIYSGYNDPRLTTRLWELI